MAPVLIVVWHKEEIRFLDLLFLRRIIANVCADSEHFEKAGPSLSRHRP